MSAEPTSIRSKARRRSAGKRPAQRTIEVRMPEGSPYEGWTATVRVDFPARVLEDMESGNVGRILAAAGRMIVAYDMPDSEGYVAETIADVDPFVGLVAVLERAMEGVRALPPR